MTYSKPNFLIVGASKSGTTSMAQYLSEHKDIFIPERKELRFFIKDSISKINKNDPLLKRILETSILDEALYYKGFEVKEKIAGEASVHYLYHYEEVIPKIKKQLGDIPIIIMLRNPVKRLLSNYEFLYNIHYNSIEKELQLEHQRKLMNFNSFWFYKELGLYSCQVKAYLDNFSKVKIIFFEDFIKDIDDHMNLIFDFLGVERVCVSKIVHNKSSPDSNFKIFLKRIGIFGLIKFVVPESKIDFLKYKLNVFFKRKSIIYSDELIKSLSHYYEEDINKLEEVMNISLELWKNK